VQCHYFWARAVKPAMVAAFANLAACDANIALIKRVIYDASVSQLYPSGSAARALYDLGAPPKRRGAADRRYAEADEATRALYDSRRELYARATESTTRVYSRLRKACYVSSGQVAPTLLTLLVLKLRAIFPRNSNHASAL
jgi:hypothetical protein